MDISKLTVRELQSLQERVEKEIKRRKQRERSKLVESIAAIASEHGYSLKELIGSGARPVKRKRRRKRKPVAVTYRHPKQADLTWAGRGRRPHWVSEWLDEGKGMEALAV